VVIGTALQLGGAGLVVYDLWQHHRKAQEIVA